MTTSITVHAIAPFVATAACSSCPFRGTCHEPRQRVQDERFAVGRHYECEFYQGISRQVPRVPLRRTPWWERISIFGGRS